MHENPCCFVLLPPAFRGKAFSSLAAMCVKATKVDVVSWYLFVFRMKKKLLMQVERVTTRTF